MAILKTDELISKISAFIGEEQNDDAISILEDVTDTLNDFESKTNDTTDWKTKYEENDKSWRAKYIARFNQGVPDDGSDSPEEEEHEAPKRFEDLFTVKEN